MGESERLEDSDQDRMNYTIFELIKLNYGIKR